MSSYEILVSGLFFILVLLWFFRQHNRTQNYQISQKRDCMTQLHVILNHKIIVFLTGFVGRQTDILRNT